MSQLPTGGFPPSVDLFEGGESDGVLHPRAHLHDGRALQPVDVPRREDQLVGLRLAQPELALPSTPPREDVSFLGKGERVLGSTCHLCAVMIV